MNPDLQKLIDLQQIDLQLAALKAEVAALPKHVAEIEAKLASAKIKVEAAKAAMKTDETTRRKHESDIQDQQQKISKYRDQSLNVKTNPEYKALMSEIGHAEAEINKLEDKILEIMVNSDTRRQAMTQAEAELKADTTENEKEKEIVRQRTAEDEKQLAQLGAQRKQLRTEVSEEVLVHYDRVLKHRGSALAAVHDDEMCSVCRVIQRPQAFQEIKSNQQIVFCSSCSRILYYVPPPPKPEEEQKKKKTKSTATELASDGAVSEEAADEGEAVAK